ncbi:hypothetical protein [Ornithinibacillus californiensis]|uniref:hypothetical protein n=1 Tax=Ornithinibacillus californiensis TaxID=161536 RepID=UPI00064DEE02|nr:hypothetical protein [Ornithinibacillus californiensis]
MNKDSLERKLESMPQAKLNHEKKDKLIQTIIHNDDTQKKRSNWNTVFRWLAPLGGTAVVALLVWILVVPNFDDAAPQASLVAEYQLADIQDLEKFSGMIKLPTYAPFNVGELHYQELFVNGIDDIIEGKVEFIQPQITYFSSDNPEQLFTILMFSTNHEHLYQPIGEGEYNEIVEFDDGLKAEYYTPSEEISHFSWIEDDMYITLTIVSTASDPIPLEEVIKIAKSFELYEVNSENYHVYTVDNCPETYIPCVNAFTNSDAVKAFNGTSSLTREDGSMMFGDVFHEDIEKNLDTLKVDKNGAVTLDFITMNPDSFMVYLLDGNERVEEFESNQNTFHAPNEKGTYVYEVFGEYNNGTVHHYLKIKVK